MGVDDAEGIVAETYLYLETYTEIPLLYDDTVKALKLLKARH